MILRHLGSDRTMCAFVANLAITITNAQFCNGFTNTLLRLNLALADLSTINMNSKTDRTIFFFPLLMSPEKPGTLEVPGRIL